MSINPAPWKSHGLRIFDSVLAAVNAARVAWRLYQARRIVAKGHHMTTYGEREITAHHEAGHAVIARALDVYVACVTIIPFAGRSGSTWHKPPKRPEGAILIAMAGPLAEARLTGTLIYGGADEERIASAIRHLSGPREHYEAQASTLVAEHWREIEIVADELLDGAGKLYGPMLDEAIRCVD